MASAVLYFIMASLQVVVSIAVLVTNVWMVNKLVGEGLVVTEGSAISWASFYILMTMAILSVVVPVIQGLLMGCLCCGGCIRRPLSSGHYMAQAVFLILQTVGWLAAAAWGTFVLINSDLFQYLGNVEYVAIACSFVAPFLAIVMTIIVLRLRSARIKADMETRLHHGKEES